MAGPLAITVLLVTGLAILYPVFQADGLHYVYAIWALSSVAALGSFLLRRPKIIVALGIAIAITYFIVFVWDSEHFANEEYGGLYVIAWTICISIPVAAWYVSTLAGYLWRR